jgi:SET domain-containing protein
MPETHSQLCRPLAMSLDTPSSHVNETKSPLYETRSLPGKGNGLVACSDIAKGTRILCEKPLFRLASLANMVDSAVLVKVKALSKDQQRQYLSLHNNYPKDNAFSGIFKTNALPCGAGSPIGAVYPTICLINHSCDSNSHHSWNDLTNSETIHALRDIKAGEEITICYANPEVYQVRRAKLRGSFGFDCDCSLCSLPLDERNRSDARRIRIAQLDEAIGDSSRVMNTPGTYPWTCHSGELLLTHDSMYSLSS